MSIILLKTIITFFIFVFIFMLLINIFDEYEKIKNLSFTEDYKLKKKRVTKK